MIENTRNDLREKLKSHKYIRVDLNLISKTPNYVIILVIILSIGLNIFFSNYIREKGFLLTIEERTHFIIQDSLLIYFIKIIIVIVVIILILGKLKPKDIGIEKKKVIPAIIIVCCIWLFYQIIGLIYTISIYRGLVFDQFILEQGWNVIVGQITAQIFGCGPYEEIIYRSFFITQIYLLFRKKEEKQNKISKKALIISLVITQIFFALIHIPDRIWENQPLEEYWMDMFSLFMYGLVFALLYLRTNNILIVAGIHALLNWTVSLFMPQFYGWIIIWISYAILLIFYPIFLDRVENQKKIKEQQIEEENY